MTVAENKFGGFELKSEDGAVVAHSSHPQLLEELREKLESTKDFDVFLAEVASDDGMPEWEEDNIS